MEKDDRFYLAKIEDELNRCLNENRITNTDFLDMRLQGLAEPMLKRSGCRYEFTGGYDTAERRLVMFLPDYVEMLQPEDTQIEVLRALHKDGGRPLSHRDYLGSLLGLGITRDKIGDIIVYPGGADIIIMKDMEEFLMSNYFKAGRTELSLSVHPIEELNLSEIRTEIKHDTLASLRLDAYLSSAFKLARAKASEAVRQGLVFVNNAQANKPDMELKEKDIIVFRGKGKSVLESVGGTSRKDRIFVEIKLYC